MIICSPELGISPESNLGGEVHDRELLKVLDDIGVEILIILPRGKKHPPFKHAKIYYLPTPVVFPPWLFNILILPYLFWLHAKYHFSILRVHSPYFVGPSALFFKLINPKVQVVATYHHLETYKLFDLCDQLFAKKYDRIITDSKASKEEIENKYGVNNIFIVPSGVEAKYRPGPKRQELMNKYGLNGKKVLLFLGQLIPRKNVAFLFKVIERLPQNYILMVCGVGSSMGELESKAPSRVIFTGQIPEKEKVDYYNLADVFVYPSLKEGFGLSVYEALSCDRPTLVNDLEVYRNIDSRNLYICPLEEDRWVLLIKNVKGHRTDFGRKYSWQSTARNYLSAIGYGE